MKSKWYNTDIAWFLYGTIFGLIVSGIDPSSRSFAFKNISILEAILSGFFGFVAFQVKHNRDYKIFMEGWFRNLRRISEDPYVEYDRNTILEFLHRTVNAKNVYSVDRNSLESWFMNDNYITFLCLQEGLIRNTKLTAYRMFIWREECFRQIRYQQLLLLNMVPSQFMCKFKNP